MRQVETMNAIRTLLLGGSHTYDQIGKALSLHGINVDKRTINRYIDELRQHADAEVVESTTGKGRQKQFGLKSTGKTSESVAIAMIHRAVRQLRSLDNASVTKAVDLLDNAFRTSLSRVSIPQSQMPYIEIGEYTGAGVDITILDSVVDAIKAAMNIRFHYRGIVTDPILPLRVIEYKGRLYVVCWSHKHSRYEPYRLDGMSHFMVYRAVRDPKTFEFDEFMSTRFGLWEGDPKGTYEVVVEITDPATADNFRERKWHPSQQITDIPGGGIRITMQCGLSPELTSWVMHWMPKVTIIQPQILRDRVRTLLQYGLNNL
ncbi:MAG: WYL domain-containing protein [Candidatus Kapabacteria bacterium]|nr:WYL domain-containing protein [Candidatus Kapabacteria bacterium]